MKHDFNTLFYLQQYIQNEKKAILSLDIFDLELEHKNQPTNTSKDEYKWWISKQKNQYIKYLCRHDVSIMKIDMKEI